MRLYYIVDAITDNCINKCPYVDIRLYGETGKDCQVGSVSCQECEFCYGHHENGFVGLPVHDNKISMYEKKYIKCMFIYKNKWPYKILKIFHNIKLLIKRVFVK